MKNILIVIFTFVLIPVLYYVWEYFFDEGKKHDIEYDARKDGKYL